MLPSWYCTFLSIHETPSPPTADLEVVTLYTPFSHCTKFFSLCRCDLPGTAHFLYLYFRCDIPDTADFLLIPHTLSFYHRCTFLYCRLSSHLAQPSPHTTDTTLLVRNTLSPCTVDVKFLIMQTFPLTPQTLSSYCRCNFSDTVCSLLTLGNLLLILQMRPS